MALFQGEELVPVTTVDGRTLQLPRSLAAMSGQQQVAPAPTGFTDETVYNVTEPEIPSVTGGQIPVPDQQTGTVAPPAVEPTDEAAPDFVVGTVDNAPATVARSNKVYDKQQKAKAAYAASPEGKQATAEQAQTNAQQAQVDAVHAQVDVDTATNDLLHAATVDRIAKIGKAEDERNQEMLTRAQEQEAKMNEVIGLRKKIENTKIDRSADHPVLLAISAALAGIGSGMKGEKVDTLDIIYRVIDRKVAAQEADLEKMGKTYGMAREEIEMLKEKSKSRLEFHNAMIAAETNKAIRIVEEITARGASDKARANGKQIIAELTARAADKTMESTRWGLEYDQRDKHQKAQLGLGYANLRQSDRHHNDSMQIRREEIAADMAKALAATKATGSAEQYKAQLEAAKESRQFGVRDVNGDLFLTPQAQAQIAQAKALEDEAAKLEANPDVMQRSIASTRIQALRDKATVMRGEAQTFGAIKAHNETEAIAASQIIASGQSTVQLIDEIKQIADKASRGVITRDDAQMQLKAKFNLMKPNLKEAWQLGAWDKGAGGLVSEVIGMDPSSAWNVGGLGMIMLGKMYEDPQAFQTGLDAVADDLEVKAKNRMVGMGVKFGQGETVLRRSALPDPSEPAAKISAAKTPLEAEKGAQPSTGGKIRDQIYSFGGLVGEPQYKVNIREAQESGSTKYIGLSKEQEAPFEERLQAYKGGNKRAGEELVAMVADSAQTRPELAIPLLRALRTNAPSTLYQAARTAIPKDSEADKQISYEEKSQLGTAAQYQANPAMFVQQVSMSIKADGTVGDTAGMSEIVRRASAGDPVAKKAFADIVKQSGHNKALPRGSMFNKGAR